MNLKNHESPPYNKAYKKQVVVMIFRNHKISCARLFQKNVALIVLLQNEKTGGFDDFLNSWN